MATLPAMKWRRAQLTNPAAQKALCPINLMDSLATATKRKRSLTKKKRLNIRKWMNSCPLSLASPSVLLSRPLWHLPEEPVTAAPATKAGSSRWIHKKLCWLRQVFLPLELHQARQLHSAAFRVPTLEEVHYRPLRLTRWAHHLLICEDPASDLQEASVGRPRTKTHFTNCTVWHKNPPPSLEQAAIIAIAIAIIPWTGRRTTASGVFCTFRPPLRKANNALKASAISWIAH